MGNRVEVIKASLTKRLLLEEAQLMFHQQLKKAAQQPTPSELSNLGYSKLGGPGADIIALMLEAKASKRQLKGETYQPLLIKTSDYCVKWMFKNLISEKIKLRLPFRYDCILYSHKGHCSAMQIEFDGEKTRLFYIDAVGNKENLPFAQLIAENYAQELYFSEPHLQLDSYNCSIFSIQHLNNLSNRSEKERTSITDTVDNPIAPVFLKNIQSISALNKIYSTRKTQPINKIQTKTLEQHVEKFSVSLTTASKSTIRNFAIIDKHYKYLKAAATKFEELLAEGGEDLVLSTIDSRRMLQLTDEEIELKMLKAFNANETFDVTNSFVHYFISRNKPTFLLRLTNERHIKDKTILRNILLWLKQTNDLSRDHIQLYKNTLKAQGINACLDACHLKVHFPSRNNLIQIEALNEIIMQGDLDINALDEYQSTPLFYAIEFPAHCIAVTEMLIKAGAKVNIMNFNGETVLDAIILNNVQHNTSTVQALIWLLVKEGAEISSENSSQLNYADLNERLVAELSAALLDLDSINIIKLINTGKRLKNLIGDIVPGNDLFLLSALVNKPDPYGIMPIFKAEDNETVTALLEAGAEINIKDQNNDTILSALSRKFTLSAENISRLSTDVITEYEPSLSITY